MKLCLTKLPEGPGGSFLPGNRRDVRAGGGRLHCRQLGLDEEGNAVAGAKGARHRGRGWGFAGRRRIDRESRGSGCRAGRWGCPLGAVALYGILRMARATTPEAPTFVVKVMNLLRDWCDSVAPHAQPSTSVSTRNYCQTSRKRRAQLPPMIFSIRESE
jgi:hypothetical protein